MTFNPYEILGVARDASMQDITAAYREKAKTAHPDTPEGSHEKFVELQKAMSILSDPKQRQLYDDVGFVPGDPESEMMIAAVNEITKQFSIMVANVKAEDFRYLNPISEIEEQIRADARRILGEVNKGRDEHANISATLVVMQKRMKKKKTGRTPDIFTKTIEKMLQAVEGNLRPLEHHLVVLERAREILNDYKYSTEERPTDSMHFPMGGQMMPGSRPFMRPNMDAAMARMVEELLKSM